MHKGNQRESHVHFLCNFPLSVVKRFEFHYIIWSARSGNVRTDRLVVLVVKAFEKF